VPAESERLRRRLSRRDLWFLAALAAAALLAVVAGLLAAGHARARVGGCVEFSHPNFTGGATYRYCGAQALSFCRRDPAPAPPLVAQCARIGVRRLPPRRAGG
jgi:hypothetical protein